ncbi:TPA: hypothetical protein ACW96C_003249 [Yersinia enterocolitica]|nr:hypothetical protein [Yersinia enterocolitica]HDL6704429.1 hypothetical protein [Yersinia enterocolitica]HDL7413884.1 hypothetical protein [Yersinia enterocolitica]HDL8438207.1 hypothetical protein [Yersinia enterocolitica]HDM8456828.1 hypothetical protein [Yersinia enterocolitica]
MSSKVVIALALILVFILFLIPIVIYLINFSYGFSTIHIRWAEFGSYFGGIYSSLSSFLLLMTLIVTIYQQNKQSKETLSQNIDKVFYKAFDTNFEKLKSLEYNSDSEKYVGVSVINQVNLALRVNLFNALPSLGQMVIFKYPALIDNHKLEELIDNINLVIGKNLIDYNDFSYSIKNNLDFFESKPNLKAYFRRDSFYDAINEGILSDIGMQCLYRIPQNVRFDFFQNAFELINDECKELVLYYVRSFNHLFALACKYGDEYNNFLCSQTSNAEKLIIYYFNICDENDINNSLNEIGFFDVDFQNYSNSRMCDMPKNENIVADTKRNNTFSNIKPT